MSLCNTMPDFFTLVASGTANGEYATNNAFTDNSYSYYNEEMDWHFTFAPTGNGTGEQQNMSSMHISIPVPNYGANASFFFNTAGTITGNNFQTLPSNEQQAANTLWTDNETVITEMAAEIVGYLNFS